MGSRLERIQDWEKIAQQAHFCPEEMAVLCKRSLRQLERFFAVRFKKSPGKWARDLRCRLARELILMGYSNKAVVAELHFGNASHFCHEFKRLYGVPPLSFVTE